MKEEVEEVAENARINLDDREAEGLAEDFEEVLGMFDKLDNIDTDDVEPSFHPVDTESRTREDEKGNTLNQEEVFQNTENADGDFFKGPSA